MTLTQNASLKPLGREMPFLLQALPDGSGLLALFRDACLLFKKNAQDLFVTSAEITIPVDAACLVNTHSDTVVLVVSDSDSITVLNSELNVLSNTPHLQNEDVVSLVSVGTDRFLLVNEASEVSHWSLGANSVPIAESRWMVECTPLSSINNGKITLCVERNRLQERDPKTGVVLKTWPITAPAAWGITDTQGHHALTIDEAGTASIWDLPGRELVFSFDTGFPVSQACFHSSGIRGALLGLDGECSLFKLAEGGANIILPRLDVPLVSVTYLNDDLLGIDENGAILRLTESDATVVGGVWAGWATCKLFYPPDNFLIGTAAGTVECFNEKGNQVGASLPLHLDAVVGLEIWENSLLSVGADASVQLTMNFESSEPEVRELASFPGRSVVDYCLCPNSGRLWLALDEGLISWFSLESPENVHEYQLAGRRIEEIRIAGEQGLLVLTDRGSVKLVRLS